MYSFNSPSRLAICEYGVKETNEARYLDTLSLPQVVHNAISALQDDGCFHKYIHVRILQDICRYLKPSNHAQTPRRDEPKACVVPVYLPHCAGPNRTSPIRTIKPFRFVTSCFLFEAVKRLPHFYKPRHRRGSSHRDPQHLSARPPAWLLFPYCCFRAVSKPLIHWRWRASSPPSLWQTILFFFFLCLESLLTTYISACGRRDVAWKSGLIATHTPWRFLRRGGSGLRGLGKRVCS